MAFAGGDPPVKGASFDGKGYDGGVKSFSKGSDGNLDTEIQGVALNGTKSESIPLPVSGSATLGGGGRQMSKKDWAKQAQLNWLKSDGPIKYIGGAGDVTGAWEILGMALASEDSNVRYVAVPLLVLKGQEDDALKVLAAEKGILSTGDALRIQNAATRINKPITVVGSRANGTAGAYSDWDYVIEGGLNSRDWSKIKNSIPGARSTLDNTPRNIDIFKGKVNTSKPHITIKPRK